MFYYGTSVHYRKCGILYYLGAKASLKDSWFDISVGAEVKGSIKLSYKQCRIFQGGKSRS